MRTQVSNSPLTYMAVRTVACVAMSLRQCIARGKFYLFAREPCMALTSPSEHGIEDPKIDEDYYVHLDSATRTEQVAQKIGPILVYPEHARTDRVAVRDVKEGRAFFSASLFV